MLQEILIDGEKYTAKNEPLRLLGLLRRHLDQTLPDSVKLRDDQLLALKAWLLAFAESMQPGKAMWLEETYDGRLTKLVAALGKSDQGESIVWHDPLPWPFDFNQESHRID